jgi:glycosyltransferase involved in cell wall biosynthesis
MRILMLAQFYHPAIGGEERHVRDLAAFLAKRGHSVGVATLWREGLPEREVDQGVNIFRMRGLTQRWRGLFSDASRTHAPPFPDPDLVRALMSITTSERIDVVHAHNWLLHSFLPLKRANGPRLVVTLHDLSLICATKTAMRGGEACDGPGLAKCGVCAARHYGATKGLVTVAANWTAAGLERRLVDHFLPVSHAVAAGSRLAGGPTPYEVIPNFVRDDIATLEGEADERLEQLPKQPFILFVGDLRRFKGVDVLIEAYSGLESAPPLVLIGRKCHDTPTRWPKNVHVFHDWPHAAIIHAWSMSMAGVLPSVGPEAFGIVLLEAMASGKPVIASSVGGIPDIVEDNVNGMLVRAGDRRGLAQAITALAADEGLRRRLAAGALRKVTAFTASNVVPRIEAVYREVLARKRPAHAAGTLDSSGPPGFSARRVHVEGDFSSCGGRDGL